MNAIRRVGSGVPFRAYLVGEKRLCLIDSTSGESSGGETKTR